MLAVSWIILSYCLNLIFSDEPIPHRILVFINIWNVFTAILIILPGYLLTEASEKLANRYGDSFEKTGDTNQLTKKQFFTNIFASKVFLPLGIVVYLILMVSFVISHNR